LGTMDLVGGKLVVKPAPGKDQFFESVLDMAPVKEKELAAWFKDLTRTFSGSYIRIRIVK